jgi:hypothetical protein
MLLILSTLVWLAAVALVVAVCQMAAEGDARPIPAAPDPPELVRDGLVVWDREAAARLRGEAARDRCRDAGRIRRPRSGRREAWARGDSAKHRG